MSIPLDRETQERLSLFGIQSRNLSVLTVILKTHISSSEPLTSSAIHDAIKKESVGSDLTKAWIHRVLKSLVEMKLVRVENEQAYRKQYTTDLETITNGLEFLKGISIEDIKKEQVIIEEKQELIERCDCSAIAETLVGSITGQKIQLSSRFIRGLDEFYRVSDNSIFMAAQEKDIIRNSLLWLSPFVTRAIDRIQKMVSAVENGTEIRYLIARNIFEQGDLIGEAVGVRRLQESLGVLTSIYGEGKIDVRIYDGPTNAYNFTSLNEDRIAFILTQEPLTAIYFTKEFNPDLILNSIASFDELWDAAPSFLGMILSYMKDGKFEDPKVLSKMFPGLTQGRENESAT
ncbi:MAG: hypothetical protein RTU92_05250 [Candidatus Thorarchaeota archaeon]